MKSLKNQYEGERVFLIGNGPSLDQTPINQLKDEYSIAMNKINDIYPHTNWRPSFYVLLLDDLGENSPKYLTENLNQGIKCITLLKHKPIFGSCNNLYFTNKKKLKYESVGGGKNFHGLGRDDIESMEIQELYNYWPNDVSEMVYSYHSMYAVIQMAIYMGFDEIYFVGCDLGYGYHNPHMIFKEGLDPYKTKNGKCSFLLDSYHKNVLLKSLANSILFKILTSPFADAVSYLADHIRNLDDNNRFSSYSQLQPEDLSHVNNEITKSHIAAKRIVYDQGVNIYNATVGGSLEVYPRVSLLEI